MASVLEPSPPAKLEEPWFADDPAAPQDLPAGELSVTPTSQGAVSWSELSSSRFEADPAVQEFLRANWLANWGQLPALPSNYETQRVNAHRLAFGVVSEARRLAVGAKFGLRWVAGGFGTPYFRVAGDPSEADQQVRVVAGQLIHQQGQHETSQPITTLRAAGEFLGIAPVDTQREHDSPPLGDLDEPLNISAATNEFLGHWFGCAAATLEELRANAADGQDNRVQLWPGHFDMAVDLGSDAAKATYGASPGDGFESSQPYLYVSPWESQVAEADPGFWNASTFKGATLGYEQIMAASSDSSAYHVVLEFFQTAFARLA